MCQISGFAINRTDNQRGVTYSDIQEPLEQVNIHKTVS